MSTPTKPERVEVGPGWKVGQKRRGTIRGTSLVDAEFTVEKAAGKRSDGVGMWIVRASGYTWGFDEDWPSALVSPAPATPGTATVTPAPQDKCPVCRRPLCYGGTGVAPTECYQGWRGQRERGCVPPASPAYGRLVGELRAPDGTPRSALEAIRAKREPERWVPAVDEWDLLPDAWPR